ncbi:MAG: FAD-binding oxidoreductase [Pseudomonadota bacterium]
MALFTKADYRQGKHSQKGQNAMTLEDHLTALPHDILVEPATGGFAEEPRGRYTSANGIIAAPKTTEGVAAIAHLAQTHGISVIPYGGGTGLVGGQVAQTDTPHIVLSLHRMASLRHIDPDNATITVEAGMILADVQATADAHGLLFPLSLAAQGSARIGGNLATNAGGLNVLRYGNARDLCLGLEVVLADGTIWHGLTGLRKDNTGYDLKHLIIGCEGTLGIITAATLRLFPKPRAYGTVLFAVPSPRAAVDVLALAKTQFGQTISAFEIMHRQGLDFLAETMPHIRLPFDPIPDWMVLMDIGDQNTDIIRTGIENCFATAFDADLAHDAILAQSDAQRDALWAVRENIPAANRLIGAVSSHDISMPISAIPDFIPQANAAIAALGPFRVNCFGHVGDGNLHYNIFPDPGKTRADYDALRPVIKRTVHDIVHQYGGSVSAEHGVGRLKVEDLERYGDPAKLAMMRAIKMALDPTNILNPGVILR